MSKRKAPALTAEAILAVDDLNRELVPVPEWGGHVYVRMMTGKEAEKFARDQAGKDTDDLNIRAELIVLVTVDGDGARIFTDDQADALAEKSQPALQRLWVVADRLNVISVAAEEELEKN